MQIISKQQLVEKLENLKTHPFFLLDVREEEEFDAGHIPKAVLAPWHEIINKVKGLKPEVELILYCRTGVRAQKAAHSLEAHGFNNISVYKGGWQDWNL